MPDHPAIPCTVCTDCVNDRPCTRLSPNDHYQRGVRDERTRSGPGPQCQHLYPVDGCGLGQLAKKGDRCGNRASYDGYCWRHKAKEHT